RELEGVALPEIERRRRLHVEVPVAENGGSVPGVVRGRNVAESELLLSERGQLGSAADAPDEVADPLACPLDVLAVRRIRADRGDRDEFTELAAPGLVHAARLYASPGGDRGSVRL